LPSWTKFPLKDFNGHIQIPNCKSVLAGHYLIIFVSAEEYKDSDDYSGSGSDVLLAVDLREKTVQQTQISKTLLLFFESDTLIHNYNQETEEHEVWKLGRNHLVRIKIESFEPFIVQCDQIKGSPPFMYGQTAQIYNDCLYICSLRDTRQANLYRFDLKKMNWEQCKLSGENSPSWNKSTSSFLVQNNLYVYQTNHLEVEDILVINLNSLELKKFPWIKSLPLFERTPSYTSFSRCEWEGDIYKGHLLGFEQTLFASKSVLRCWNIENHSWLSVDVQKLEFDQKAIRLFVYKNSLVTFGKNKQELNLAFLNLDHIVNLGNTKSPEEERILSLFMSEEESDVSFKVEDKTLPAHKDILIQKSKYFANLFNSGMVESRQNIIEIPDCEFQVFQEFLRFLYFDKVKLDPEIARKLFIFAEKHLKYDLQDKCVEFLGENNNLKNVYTNLDFAREQGISQLQSWCVNFCLTKIDLYSVSGLIKYLEKQSKSEFADENLQLRNRVLYVLSSGRLLNTNPNMKSYIDFILRNIEIDSIERIVKLICLLQSNRQMMSKGRVETKEFIEAFDQDMNNLKSAVFTFVQENFEEIKDKEIMKNFSQDFLINYAQHVTQMLNKSKDAKSLEINGNKQETPENSNIPKEEETVDNEQKKR